MQSDGLNEQEPRKRDPESQAGREVEIRRLAYADLPAAIAIERRSFPTPWSLAMFLSELSRPQSVCLAASSGPELIGYLICARYGSDWHLASIAVAPERRRRGLGTALIQAMFENIGNESPVTLEVRPSNGSAIAMYERLGFRLAGRRHRYYPDNGEDAIIMWRNREPDPDPEPALHG